MAVAALVACSTPPKSSPESVEDLLSYFISITNRPVAPTAQTNAPLVAVPVLTNAPLVALPVLTNAAPAPGVAPAPPPVQTVAPAPVKPRQRTTWVASSAWTENNNWGKPERVRDVSTWTYELKSAKDTLLITAGNRTALWNGVNLELGFAPRLTNGQAYVHRLDIEKTFDPLELPSPLVHRTNRVIVIDPGHGGENYGAKSALSDRYEKQFALDWALRLERRLRESGWKVYLTRTNDIDIPLAERISFADRVSADLFVSLHFNSTDQPQGRSEHGGIETYCLTPVGMPSTLTRHFEDDVTHAWPNNAFDAENYRYATRLHAALVAITGRKDRGVRRARFMGVLRGQNRPAVLLEGGYLTLPAEARLIGQSEYLDKLAEAVVTGLSD